MYLIVVGGGRTARAILELAIPDGHDVVAIERDPQLAEELEVSYDCMVINADATSAAILEEAGVREADALIATTADESVNLMACMFARKFGVDTLVSSVTDPKHIELFRGLGVEVTESPHRLNGRYLYRSVDRPAVEGVMEIADTAEILEIEIEEQAPIAGLTIDTASKKGFLTDQSVVIAVVRDGDLHIPRGDTRLDAGDTISLLRRRGHSAEAEAAFTANGGTDTASDTTS